MSSRGPGRRAPRASRAARTPKPGTSGGPFSDQAKHRLISAESKPVKLRADEAEENFRAVHDDDGTRLQKVLASAGVASRRVSENLIAEGRVMVDGLTVIEPGVRVVPEQVIIHVDGVRLNLDVEHQYVMLNKPAGVMTTMSDPEGRRCVGDFLTDEQQAARLVHVGRLDYETEGLLLLTNDGDLTHQLTHPSYEVPKTYMAELRGSLPKRAGAQLKAGIELEDGPVAADAFTHMGSSGGKSMVELTIHSGRNRIVRRIFEHLGHPVTRLVRTAIGGITIGDQPQGTVRELTGREVGYLQDLVSGPRQPEGSEA
ncbi:pseudouridine synthase [Nesterenkonia populi]|uniref:pseudouridine synthase n=1 Tax=Nesterenkonia populi TaxID=1591087 RepID=UPI0011BE33D3|nr:pseudouridine synthase [Nesterenkonia populi]